MSVHSDKVLDCKGDACPMPIVKTKKAMDGLNSGEVLEVQATDKGAKSDMTAWANSSGHELVQSAEEDGVLKFWIKKS
ncbi:sulfurtransferase TusA family protein [Pseudalkalibacillus caeni]|uniref:Sulfurtransferase TusA family protein n=1 Tax=Exobacillus caeni TaxID=2574798 RepID=A0A5R9F2S9_9BACL|nr:sulfurtransferase TusA family protein [Pseudalkalibacillus caeni]TLS35848.1 sulfurtransferase TusA family protein [Pseudalkalibacillus caeni]